MPELVATSCRSMFIKSHGVSGTLYRVGEDILIKTNDEEVENVVIKATDFFAVHLSSHCSFIRGRLYKLQHDEEVHSYSGNSIVVPTSTSRVFSSSSVLRKLMLYPDPNNLQSPEAFIVVDFNRTKIPITLEDIIIPAYPVEGDMVVLRGDNDELWHAHVLSTDKRLQTCKVHFYIEDATSPGKYVRETTGRMAVHSIHWNTIVRDVSTSGYWKDDYWQTIPHD